jgi:hypothetical protein
MPCFDIYSFETVGKNSKIRSQTTEVASESIARLSEGQSSVI